MSRTTPPTDVARRIGWGLAWIALGVISLHFLVGVYTKYQQIDPAAYTMFWSRRGWLWTHLAGGGLTILLGPVQYFSRWPRDWPRLHRWTGRVYLGAMLVACVGATGLIATSPAPFEIRSAFAATALAWLATALVALIAIRRGRVARHRRWMTRNYLVTLSPVTFRILLPSAIAVGLAPSATLIAILLWLSWVLPLLVAEAVYRVVDAVRAARPQHASAERSEPLRERRRGSPARAPG
jgi:uncharacterized membrane protein